MRVLRWLPVAIGTVALPCLLLAGSADAAARCAQVSVTPGVQGPTLTPAKVTITAGGCVSYVDNTPLRVTITVGKVSGSADPNTAVTFREPAAGTFAVKARQQFQSQPIGGTGNGSLVVRPAPKPPSSPTPRPTVTRSPAPQPSSSASSGPVIAPGRTLPPPTAPGVTPSLSPLPPTGPPPVVVGIAPSSEPPSSPAAVVAGPLQPPSGRGVGLPAAVAALLLVGAGAAFARVLLAEPLRAVDGGRFVVGAP